MSFNIVNPIGTGTDEELLALTRAAIARITAFGSSRTADGRMLTEANLAELRKQVDWLEQKIAATAASTSSGGNTTTFARRRRP